ncbi:MAG TPA: inositol monophosphatase family protein [Acidimicrobiales bacterium]|nr:inositol monophosphatase family protein [Acidimicrobiales bacterium]
MNPDLELALELCEVADALTLVRFRAADLLVETKPDLTPVSEVDRAVEVAVRDRLAVARPAHSVLGEELGAAPVEGADWRWLVDPIDGTKNYVRGIPVFATLLALQHGDETVLGVVSAPALGRRWWAARGEGAYVDGRPARVSLVGNLHAALLSYDDVVAFSNRGVSDQFATLAGRCWRARSYSDFWGHMLVAEGAAEAMVQAEPGAKVWDLAPLQVIVEEAGGRFSDLDGNPGPNGGTAISSNGLVHEEVVASLRSPAPQSSATS